MYSDTKGMSSDNYVVIQGFMCNELNLKGNELLVFALIYGFCQDGKSVFSGGRKYIADTFNISMPTVDKALQGLIDKELIIKHSSGDYVHPDIYTIGGSKETLLGVVKKLYEGSKETLPNNIDNKLENNINNSTNVELEQATPTRRVLITVDNPVSIKTSSKKKSRYEQCMEVIDDMIEPKYIELKQVLADYLTMRLAIKDKPMYVSGWKALIRKLKELSQDASEQYKIVRQSLENSWATFYPLKKNYKGQDKRVFSEYGKVKTGNSGTGVISNVSF